MVYAHDSLSSNGADLDFHIDDTQRLRADIDLDQTRVHRLVELSKAGHETHGTFLPLLESRQN